MSDYIKGIDISNNNSSIDFSSVANDGVEYVYVKATEGKSFQDSTMVSFYNECKSNNLKVGAYHFLVSSSEPEAQAQNFYNMIKDYSWDLVPMMDVETMSGFDASTLCDYVTRFKTEFESLCSLTLGIYSYTSFIENLEGAEDSIKNMPFWEANYNNDPWNLSDTFFVERIGHQFTESGSIGGINEGCDVNYFTEGVLLDSTVSGEWQQQDGKWWYKHSDGTYTKSGWEKINSKWYLFDAEGYMLTGFQLDGDKYYYLYSDGSMATGWIPMDSSYYYFNDKGVMQIGWSEIDSKWYYFNEKGVMQTGWIKDGDKLYCCYSDGSMIHDCELYGYKFGSDGLALKLATPSGTK